ncbi:MULTISPECIES: hypothetical protein [Rhodopirellula]|jgi:hypothetical protein|uniref:hypothetical protein n=1 Tax=Rhodopirellula TaxID=265488 RepID=UPI00056AD898|nr:MULTISPECIES: hypothetical protein [Rhodopirellula]
MTWLLYQLLSYSLLLWLLFVAITGIASFVGRGWGIMIGHIAIALLVIWLDAQWVQSEIAKPDWDGAPDQDIVFIIGVLIRVVLINAMLLPVASASRWLSVHRRSIGTQPVA